MPHAPGWLVRDQSHIQEKTHMINVFSASFGTRRKKLTGTAMLGAAMLALAACQTAPATAGEPANGSTSGTALPQGVTTQTAPAAGTTTTPAATSPQRSKLIGMANPASVHCINAGGKLEIRTGASGGQYGICHMPDGNSCEEWSFFRTGKCTAETLKNR